MAEFADGQFDEGDVQDVLEGVNWGGSETSADES